MLLVDGLDLPLLSSSSLRNMDVQNVFLSGSADSRPPIDWPLKGWTCLKAD